MKVEFKDELKRFQDAGNRVIGAPWRVNGTTRLVWRGKGHTLSFGEGVDIRELNFNFDGADGTGGTFTLGDRCVVRIASRLGDGCTVSIGSGTVFNKRTSLSPWERTSIAIGKDCLFADVIVRTCDMHALFDIETGERFNHSKDVFIEDRVWLADRAMVMKGARIGTGSIIGAGAIVSGDIPESSLAVGVPAKVIRRGVAWSRELADRMSDN